VLPLRDENADFWPVSKFNTGSLPLRGNSAGINVTITIFSFFFAPTAGARYTIFPKLCLVIELVETIKKVLILF